MARLDQIIEYIFCFQLKENFHLRWNHSAFCFQLRNKFLLSWNHSVPQTHSTQKKLANQRVFLL